MKIDAAVFDLDGTLLNDQKEITAASRRSIQQLQAAGVKIILATGRNEVYVRGLAHELGQVDAILSCNGAAIRQLDTDEIIYSCYLPGEAVAEIADYCLSRRLDFTASVHSAMYCVDDSPRIGLYQDYNQSMPEKFQIPIRIMRSPADLAGENILKMFIWQMSAAQQQEFLHGLSLQDVNVVASEQGALDIGHSDTSKGAALAIFAQRHNIDLCRTAVFGDYDNDISMMEKVGYSIAMGNGSDNAKRCARYLTKSNNEEGVAWGIEQFLL